LKLSSGGCSAVSEKASSNVPPFDLYGSINTSLTDISLCQHSPFVEPFRDPRQNFYATSTTERHRRHEMLHTPSSSVETLDELHGQDNPAAYSPRSITSSLDCSVSPSRSPDSAAVTSNENSPYPELKIRSNAFPVGPRRALLSKEPTFQRDYTDSVDFNKISTEENNASDSVDGGSFRADSGIESITPSLRKVSGEIKASHNTRNPVAENPVSVASSVPASLVSAPKRFSHARSASDYIARVTSHIIAADSGKLVQRDNDCSAQEDLRTVFCF
jgi:hypothetical protein